MMESMLSVSFYSQRTGNWSKWGGARMGFVSLVSNDEWFCQVCGERQTKNMPGYMIPINILNRDFTKVCCECKYKSIVKKLKTYFELKTHNKSLFDTPLFDNP